ncbi:monocarboxylate transporter 9-like [Diorhabda sublineata]|uniref:monocarboxylate transporter 9-like n=1 Tax=Diorhabda sublineata TaxID=1163346 RepID=UPI0024E061E4|nr:monocarboxylate transporter 9-like [Diorhabda sublineata]
MSVTAPIVKISEVAPSVESLQETPPDTETFNNSTLRIDHKFQGRGSILSSEISLFIEKTGQKIPDGGWGWLVVLACFVINMLSDGVGFTFGLLYKEFLIEFGASKSATSWIGSLFMALPLIAGPLGSALVDKYGCMTMTIAGGIVCTSGLALSSYAQTIGVMYLTFGVVGGLGLTLCFVTAVVSIAFWFEKKRTVALGLAASGTGFGTALYSPLATWLLSEYGWRGTLLITAGFFANMCVCGALMRDPDWIIEEEKEEKRLKKARKWSVSSIDTECLEEIKQTLEEGGDTQYLLQDVDATLDLTDKDRFNSVVDLPTFVRDNEKVPLEVLKHLSENKQIYDIIVQNYPNLLAGRSSSDQGMNILNAPDRHTSRVPVKFSMNIKKQEECWTKRREFREKMENNANLETMGMAEAKETQNKGINLLKSLSVKAKTQIQPQSYLKNVRFRKNSIGYRGAMLNIHKYKVKASSCPDIYKNSMATLFREEESWYDEFIDILKDLTNFSLFLDLHFLLLSLSTVMVDMWFVVPYYYLADHMAIHHYTDNEAAFAISVIGITNTIGMVLLGIVGNRINTAKTYAICLILCGASVGIMIVVTSNYILILVSGGFFGLFFASTMSLTPSLLAELVSLDDFTMAYGLLLLSQGIGTLLGPPLAGWVFDLTGSWDQSFYQACIWIIISGLLVGVIPFTRNRKLFTKK